MIMRIMLMIMIVILGLGDSEKKVAKKNRRKINTRKSIDDSKDRDEKDSGRDMKII